MVSLLTNVLILHSGTDFLHERVIESVMSHGLEQLIGKQKQGSYGFLHHMDTTKSAVPIF